jgi:quinol-cytochrome oxidoreductase complex cytochrome b subunit
VPGYTLGLGLISLFLFGILTVTGILLMIYYVPSVERAYASISDIIAVVPGGRFIRNMHRWAAHGMVLSVTLHMARVFYTGSYARGRGVNWFIGVLLFVLTLLLSFTGYLLPWDQLAYWAVTIGSNIAGSATELTDALGITDVFDPGRWITLLLLGATSVGQDALIRFYLLHIVLLPLIAVVLIGLHFWRIRKDGGLSRPDHAQILPFEDGKRPGVLQSPRPDGTILSWPTAIWAEASVFLLVLATVLVAGFALDAPLLGIADPATPENPAKAPWYFLGIQELVSYSAFSGGIVIPLLLLTGLLLIPVVDRNDEGFGRWFSDDRGTRTTVTSLLFSIASVVTVYALTVTLGWIRDWVPGIHPLVTILVNPGTLIVAVLFGWTGRILKKTGSTRLAGIAFITGAGVMMLLFTVIGLWFRGPDWQFYLSPSMWPTP